jgi:hypothetical protein
VRSGPERLLHPWVAVAGTARPSLLRERASFSLGAACRGRVAERAEPGRSCRPWCRAGRRLERSAGARARQLPAQIRSLDRPSSSRVLSLLGCLCRHRLLIALHELTPDVSAVTGQGARDLNFSDPVQIADRPVELFKGVVGGLAVPVRLLLLDACYSRLLSPRHLSSPSPFVGGRLLLRAAYPSGSGRNRLGDRGWFGADRPGHVGEMTIGTSIFLIAVGAILAFAVDATVAGFSIQTAGVILMVAGVVGLLIGLFLINSRRARPADRTVYDDRAGRTVYEDRPL